MGIFLGLLASAAFGLIPLFVLPLMAEGLPRASVLFYRFLFGTLILGAMLLVRQKSFYVPARDYSKIAGISLLYTLGAQLLFWGYSYAPSGVATTLHFLYPVLVMLIMTGFFHERFSWATLLSIVLAISGVGLLCWPSGSVSLSLFGLAIILLSSLAVAAYIAGLHVARITSIGGLSLTFHVMAWSTLYALVYGLASDGLRLIATPREFTLLFLLALITAVISNYALVLAIKRIGSTLSAVLGAMEPLTAVLVGIVVFQESFTLALSVGVVLILLSVMVVVLGPQLLKQRAPKAV